MTESWRAWASTLGLEAVGGLVAALLVFLLYPVVVFGVTRRTRSDLDDILTARLRLPLSFTCLAVGLWYAAPQSIADPNWLWAIHGSLATFTVVLWTVAIAATSRAVLQWLVANRARYSSIVTDRTLPVFDIAAKTFLWGGSIYFVFLAWEVDVTGWLASAGVVGVAVGFAAKDTLSNLIAGVFILADAPYKLGDYLVLDNGDRGEVVEIGIRTTRIRTRDDVEVIVPNALMANSKIVNQSGGPFPGFRIRLTVSVAYGSDVDRVRELLDGIIRSESTIMAQPEPRLRFRAFGESGLVYELMGWVAEPGAKGLATDRLLTTIYKSFQAEGIEIPYPKRDLYLHRSYRDRRIPDARQVTEAD